MGFKSSSNNNCPTKTVALKCLHNSQNNISKLLDEIELQVKLYYTNTPLCYGISKDAANNYLIVMQYATDGNLHDYLQDNFGELDWEKKLRIIYDVSEALREIHKANFNEATIDIITEIMKGGRPYIPTSSSSKEKYNIPKVIADCIKKCWDEDKDKRPDIVTLNNFFKDLLIINKDYKKWKPYREKDDGDDDDVESCCNSCREINITDYVTTQWDLTIPERVP
nr:12879_t:CDS:2 [Entrophospora candida]